MAVHCVPELLIPSIEIAPCLKTETAGPMYLFSMDHGTTITAHAGR